MDKMDNMDNIDTTKTNRVVHMISLAIGTLTYWLILSSYITSAYVFAMAAAGYIICILFLLTRYNEYVINKDNHVMKRYCDDVMCVCPKCGETHISIYSKVFYSRMFMIMLKNIMRNNQAGAVHIVKIAKCDKCNHTWYGGYMNIRKINSQFEESCVQNNI